MRRTLIIAFCLISSLVWCAEDELVIDLYPPPYCVDNEVSLCMQGHFKGNITQSLRSSGSLEDSFTLFCTHIGYALECLKAYTEIMCSADDRKAVKTKLHNNLAPFDQLYAEKCKKNLIPADMKKLFNNKGCLQPYDVLEGCLSEFYYSVNYFMHQDSGSKLFCDNLVKAFAPCLQRFFEKCIRDVKYDKNDMIKSLIIRYPACQSMTDEELNRKFPSDHASLQSQLHLWLLHIALAFALIYGTFQLEIN